MLGGTGRQTRAGTDIGYRRYDRRVRGALAFSGSRRAPSGRRTHRCRRVFEEPRFYQVPVGRTSTNLSRPYPTPVAASHRRSRDNGRECSRWRSSRIGARAESAVDVGYVLRRRRRGTKGVVGVRVVFCDGEEEVLFVLNVPVYQGHVVELATREQPHRLVRYDLAVDDALARGEITFYG